MPYFQYSDSVQLYYEEHGNPNGAETVVFLNGVMASAGSWSLLWPVFERAGFRVIAHDFKGQLKSSKPEGPYTFDEHCAETRALLAHLGVEHAHLIGTSYGGEIAMKMAILYPDFVRSISVIDSVSELDPVCEGFVVGWKVLCDTMDGETFFWGMAPSIYGPAFIIPVATALKDKSVIVPGLICGILGYAIGNYLGIFMGNVFALWM